MTKRILVLSWALWASSAAAGDAIGNSGSVRGDYWTRFNDFELNVAVNAIPFVDIELGVRLDTTAIAHVAVGPRIEVLSRESDGGATIRIVVLAGAWFTLGNPVSLSHFSASPGVEATYWFARRFGITASVSVPFLIPFSGGQLNTAAIQGSPRLGLGISF